MSGAHRIVRHGAVRHLPGYHPREAPAIRLAGASTDRSSEHGRATSAQWERRGSGRLGDEVDAGIEALRAAGVPRGARKQARRAAEEHFYSRLGLGPDTPLHGAGGPPAGEPLGAALQEALADVVEMLAEGRYDDLAAASTGTHRPDDLRARVEEDYGARLSVPPPEHYARAFVARAGEDEHGEAWGALLDLWNGGGVAELHVEITAWVRSDGDWSARLEDVKP